MKLIRISAPGKVILAGEHAVVYGYPALVAAIDRRLTVTVIPKSKGPTTIRTKAKNTFLVEFALQKTLTEGEVVDITIDSDLPVGGGLGSSAALATALVWSLKPNLSLGAKNKLVKKIEDHQHGTSSGVDQTIVREGGTLRFEKEKGFKPVKLNLPPMLLINSGTPAETTGEMVAAVAANFQFSKANFQSIFKQIGKIVDNWSPKLIKENERLLEELGIVGEKAKKIVREIEAIGGMAKVCGAGGVKAGSGMLLAYHSDINKLKQLAKESQWPFWPANLGAEGVRYEN